MLGRFDAAYEIAQGIEYSGLPLGLQQERPEVAATLQYTQPVQNGIGGSAKCATASAKMPARSRCNDAFRTQC